MRKEKECITYRDHNSHRKTSFPMLFGVDLGLLLGLTLFLDTPRPFLVALESGRAPGVSPVVHHEGLPWVLFVDVANQVNLLQILVCGFSSPTTSLIHEEEERLTAVRTSNYL